jgi:hypothetical protein
MQKITTKKKSSSIKWFIAGSIILLVLFGYKYSMIKKETSQKREAFDTQRKVMIVYWEEQGLSDEEIQEKLKNLQQERVDSGKRSPRTDIMRILGNKSSMER